MLRMTVRLLMAFMVFVAVMPAAFAGKVISVKAEKGTVVVDEGTGAGVAKGQQYCVFDSSDAEVGCGKIVSVTAKNAAIRLGKEVAAKVEKGMVARAKDGEAAPAEDVGAKKKGKKGAAKGLRNIKVMYVPGLVPAGFSLLSLGYSKDTSKTEYKETGNNNVGIIGLGLEFEMPVGTKSLAIGFRYRLFAASTAVADYEKGDIYRYWETKQSGTALGLWFDYYFMVASLGKTSTFKLGAGLDLDQSTVTSTFSVKTDDASKKAVPTTGSEISSTSKVGVVSLRIPISFVMYFDPLGLNFDVVPMVPLTEFGSSISMDPASDDSSEFKKSVLKHKRASFAADVRLGLFFGF